MNEQSIQTNAWIKSAQVLLNHSEPGTPAQIMQSIQDGIMLRRAIAEESADPTESKHPELDDQLEALQDEATARLIKLASNTRALRELNELTSWGLRADQSYLTELLTRPDLDSFRRAALLDLFRLDLVWLTEWIDILDGQEPMHPTVSARIELDQINDEIREQRHQSGLEEQAAQLAARSVRLERRLLDSRISRLLRQVTDHLNPVQLWNQRFLLSRLQAEVEALPEDPPFPPSADGSPTDRWDQDQESNPGRHLESLKERREALGRLASERLEALPEETRLTTLEQLVAAARSESNEVSSIVEDLEGKLAVQTLAASIEDFESLRAHTAAARQHADSNQLSKTMIAGLRRASRRFRAFKSGIRSEWQEKELSVRLQARFGSKFPKFLDGLVLFLIVGLTALIVIETWMHQAGPLNPRTEAFFAWSDLGICAVFLFDFFLKLSMAPAKFLYFRRHALLDFLPSIPFGYLAFALSGPTSAANVGLIRTVRLTRLVRYLRILRPVVRFLRLFIFLFRFTDRLVLRYANVFNRNIILFEPNREDQGGRLSHQLFQMRKHFERRAPEHYEELNGRERLRIATRAVEALELRLQEVPPGDWSEELKGDDREIPVEEVIERLIEITPEELVEQMGPTFVGSIDRYLRLFDVPFVRNFPVIHSVLEYRQKGPAEAVALLANYIGYFLQRAMDVIYYFADLQATVSPPLFLDKLGRTIVGATKRPATRLFTFGIGFAVLYVVAEYVIPGQVGTFLSGIAKWLASKLGLPVVGLGVICFFLMLLGNWFKKIANQASDFSERIVEAQFAAQTKSLKDDQQARDLRFLAERVTIPEIELRSSDDRHTSTGFNWNHYDHVKEIDTTRLTSSLDPRMINGLGLAEGDQSRLKSDELDFLHSMRLLYNDYLDGSPFNRNDTKASTQLLGNLSLINLSLSHLNYFLKQRKKLEKLDLNRSAASLFGGPYLWFDYITRLIVQETAKLLIDYNRHAIPLERLACSPRADRERYRGWLATRLDRPESEIKLPEPIGVLGDATFPTEGERRPQAEDFFETVEFTAVDFLTADPRRDQVIRERFGDSVGELLHRDREQNLRNAFRSLALHQAPMTQRTVNLYQIYERYLGKGKLLILPLRFIWWGIRGVGLLLGRILLVIREILNPSVADGSTQPSENFSDAVRKIHRMRKPAFMESLWLRARFDVEYLGLALPSVPISVGSDTLIETDLDFVGASRHERIMADRFREQQRQRLHQFSSTLLSFGWGFDQIAEILERDFPHLADRRAEVIRALVTAWMADHDDISSLGIAIEALRTIAEAAADPSHPTNALPEGLPLPIRSSEPRWYSKTSKRGPWKDLLDLPCFPDYDRKQRRRIIRTWKRNKKRVKGWVQIIQDQGGPNPLETLANRLREVILRTDLWSDQIITLRAVQTLTMLDVQHYSELVWKLGGYQQMPGRNTLTELPFSTVEAPHKPVSV